MHGVQRGERMLVDVTEEFMVLHPDEGDSVWVDVAVRRGDGAIQRLGGEVLAVDEAEWTEDAILWFDGPEHAFLSNSWAQAVPICFDGILSGHVEGAYQSAKTLDHAQRRRFGGLSPAEAHDLGTDPAHTACRPDWENIKRAVMHGFILQKFAVDRTLRRALIATYPRTLIDVNTRGDRFWGVDAQTGQGYNHLGGTLMLVRAQFLGIDWAEEQ